MFCLPFLHKLIFDEFMMHNLFHNVEKTSIKYICCIATKHTSFHNIFLEKK